MNRKTIHQAFAVVFARRDGTPTSAIRETYYDTAAVLYDAVARHFEVISAELREQAQPGGDVVVLASTRDGLDHICAGCLAVIVDNRLSWKGYPYCAACAQRIEDELRQGRT